MTAFRDNFVNEPAFAQHIGVAEDLLDEIERIPARIEAAESMTQEVLDHLARNWAEGWQNTWEQLQEARAIVVARGRDVSAYDAARADAGDLFLDVAGGKAVHLYKETHFTWKNQSTRPARTAIAALRAAMPEVIVTKQAPVDVDLSMSRGKLLQIVGVVAGLAVVMYVLYRVLG